MSSQRHSSCRDLLNSTHFEFHKTSSWYSFLYKSRFAFDRLRVANPFCNACVSQVQLLCHKSITGASHRQGVLRNFSGQKCKKFKNRSVQNHNTSATTSGSVPFFSYTCVALRVCFPRSATHFCSFTHFSLKSQTYQKCILLHSYSFDCILCIFRFSRTQKKTPRPAFLQSAVPAFRSPGSSKRGMV